MPKSYIRTGRTINIRCVCPESLGVFREAERHGTVSFLQSIRKASRRDGISLLIDFHRVQHIHPSGAILLTAEIHRALHDPTRKRVVYGNRAQNSLADQVLKQIGIYELLAVECSIEPDDETVRHWRAASGNLSEGEKGGSLIEKYDGRLADGIARGIYDGIVEAMTNTLHHAYIGKLGKELCYGLGRRWWMLSQEKDQALTVAICDLGIGIPRSLPLGQTFSRDIVRHLWSKLKLDRNDGNAIKVALELGRTRTNQKGRGKGLSEIIDAVNLSDDGMVLISSNRGIFTSSAEGGYTHTDSHSIQGTLILWRVPVAAKDDEGNGD